MAVKSNSIWFYSSYFSHKAVKAAFNFTDSANYEIKSSG